MTTRSTTSLLLASLLAIGCGGDDKQLPPGCDDPESVVIVYTDADGDGFGDPATQSEACELVAGLVEQGDDCNDADERIFPGAAEECDGLDNNCDLAVDEGLNLAVFYADTDGDGFGDPEGATTAACVAPPGYADNTKDCDDSNAQSFPGNTEVCDGIDNDCDNKVDDKDPDVDDAGRTTFYADMDGDSYGDPENTRRACVLPPKNYVENADDCNDNAPGVFPGGSEICNGRDDDCDGLVDDDDDTLDTSTWNTWYEDADGDTFGNADVSLQQCARPAGYTPNDEDCDDNDDAVRQPSQWRLDADGDGVGAGAPLVQCDAPADHVPGQLGEDCDDADPDVFPGQIEICNTIDDDCDGDIDDADDDLDETTADVYHPDLDGDGYGDRDVTLYRCQVSPNLVVDGSDCDDDRPGVNPDGVEVCDGIDNDCNDLTDDEDPAVDPAGFQTWFPDVDRDGFGDLAGAHASCFPPEGYIPVGTDCDDADDTIGEPPLWYTDADGDGHGTGLPVFGPACTAPAGLAPGSADEDCDDNLAAVNPSATEVCEDGVDNDCDGVDLACPLPESCEAWASTTDGVYTIEPVPYAGQFDVYCDNTVDDGGWTLVASSFDQPLGDRRMGYHANLTTLEPAAPAPAIWDGLAPVLGDELVDVRFACKEFVNDAFFTVDLVFYDVDWYGEFVTGTDDMSCFSEDEGLGYDQVPARLDVLTNAFLPAGDDWNAGFLEGEDTCDDPDFSIDFDDRGVGGDPDDGTDWGFADGVEKCGVSGAGEAWYLFVR